MSALTLQFKSLRHRRFPDPLNSLNNGQYQIEHHVLVCEAKDLPVTPPIPTDPNPRAQNVNKAIYKEVKESLIDATELNFHLKNKGITVIAKSVSYDKSSETHLVEFKRGTDGIVDGAHTYQIIKDNLGDCPNGQCVKIEILTGVPYEMIVDIAKGLNTSVQVQQMSLANLSEKFDWIKETLGHESYANQIAYRENDDGEFSIRDIVSFLTLFNIEQFPSDSEHPKIAYGKKEECLTRYVSEKWHESYKKLQPILADILQLHDYIQLKSIDLYNTKYSGKGGSLSFVQSRKRGKYQLVFSGSEAQRKLLDGALYPIFGAFRYLVEANGAEKFGWKGGSFEHVKELFQEVAADMMNATKNTSESRGRNPHLIGKDDSHWDNLYKTVQVAYLTKKITRGLKS